GDRGMVAAGAGGGVAGEVLESGDHPGRLQAAHVLGGEHAGEVGVLAHGLLDAAPAVVAHDVQHRGQSMWVPIARMSAPIRWAIWPISSGSKEAPQAIAAG